MTTDYSVSLAQVIRNRRITEGYTQAELANACQSSPSCLSQIETGKLFPSAKLLFQIAEILHIRMSYLLIVAACSAFEYPHISDRKLNEISLALKQSLQNRGEGDTVPCPDISDRQ